MNVAVTGLGLWTPGFPSLEAWLAGDRDTAVIEPACALPGPRAKRGTSRITRMLCEVVEQAARDGRADLSAAATVYASAWGEIDIMIGLLEQIHDGDVGLSPLRFKHSVHNAASGLVSIAAENRSFSTAIAAGDRTVEQGLIEAWALLASGAPDVILAVGDDRLPVPLERFGRYEGLAAALCLSVEPGDRPVRAWLEPPTRLEARVDPTLPPELADNPCAWVLPLLGALTAPEDVVVPLSPADRPFAVRVRP